MNPYLRYRLLTIALFLIIIVALQLDGCMNQDSLLDSEQASAINGTVVFYHFDEVSGSKAIDSSGNGFNGTIFGPPRVAGKVGQALQFGATGDRVEMPPPYDIFFQSQAITVDLWINPATLNPGALYQIVGSPFSSIEMKLRLNNGKVEFKLFDCCGGSQTIITSATSLTTSTWYYVAVTFNGSDARLYINGVLDSSSSTTFPIPHIDNTIYVGGTDGATSQFLGIIDEFRISNIVLTDTEIADYYQKTNI